MERRSDPFWYDDVGVLFRHDRLTDFFPCSSQTPAEQFNSVTRFCLYAGIILSVGRRTLRFAMVALLLVTVLYLGAKNTAVKGMFFRPPGEKVSRTEGMATHACQAPTKENPFSNVLLTDYQDRPDRPPACSPGATSEALFYEGLFMNTTDVYNRQVNSRQFYSTPNTQIPNDQTGFAEWLYRDPSPTCKESGLVCTGHT